MHTGMLSRLLTTKEQAILIGVACAICVGAIVLVLSRLRTAPDASMSPSTVPEPADAVVAPELPISPTPPEQPVEATLQTPRAAVPSEPLAVAIAGAVKTPGVYTLRPESRVKDLIEAAGGPREDADLGDINRAAQLIDGTTLTIPTGSHAAVEGERLVVRGAPRQLVANPRPYTISGWGYDVAVPRPRAVENEVTASAGAASAGTSSGLIDINRASLEELDTLPGIGEVKARSIIDYREQSPFRTVDDLEEVDGIGKKTLEKLRPLVTVGAL